MNKIFLLLGSFLLLISCGNSQDKPGDDYKLAGGPCEGCEAVFEYGEKQLTPVDTLPLFNDAETKIKITGTIYQSDGKTPAEDVILYIYHTNEEGIYETKGDEKGWARRHGFIRGWIKTGSDGKYTFYTFKPGVYPTRNVPAHIHPIILEPNGTYYYIKDYNFDDDELLGEEDRNLKFPRGGTDGILSLKMEEGILTGYRDIILGKNIPDYK